jgi:hypothetical protein
MNISNNSNNTIVPLEFCISYNEPFTYEEEVIDPITNEKKKVKKELRRNIHRDNKIDNRYWIDYPAEWRTSNMSNRIIGFRSLFLSTSKRYIKFALGIKKPTGTKWPSGGKHQDSEDDVVIMIHCYISIHDGWNILYENLKKQIDKEFGEANNFSYIYIEWTKMKRRISPVTVSGKNWCYYNNNTIGPDPIYSEDEVFGLRFTVNHLDPISPQFPEDTRIFIFPDYQYNLGDDSDFLYMFNCNEDYIKVMEDYVEKVGEETGAEVIEFYNIFDRHSCMIRSEIVGWPNENYLGYTNVRYNPLKYYRITDDSTQFYIDLYNGHSHTLPAVLPKDNKDYLNLELVILQGGQEQLYT